MRFLRYSAGGTTSLGVIEGDQVAEISGDLFGTWQRTGRTVREVAKAKGLLSPEEIDKLLDPRSMT